jgi:ribulose bisphosphate carboxylase small subunit
MSIITKLESKIEDLHRDWNNAQAIININPTSIQEYIKLKEDTSIQIGIRYISLEAIAKEYHLYQDDREVSELKDLIGREIDIPSHSDVLQSVQTIRDKYRQIYECNGREFDRYERLIEQIAQRYSQENDMSTNPNKDIAILFDL